MAVSERLLNNLSIIAFEFENDSVEASCPHHYYRSVSAFVGQLLWSLKTDYCCRDAKAKHLLVVLVKMMEDHRVCSLCRSTIVLRIYKDDFYPKFGKSLSDSCCVLSVKLRMFFFRDFISNRHIMKLCTRSCRVAGFLGLLGQIKEMLHTIAYHPHNLPPYSTGMTTMTDMMRISVKYWNDQQYKFYLRYHFAAINHVLCNQLPLNQWLNEKNDDHLRDWIMMKFQMIQCKVAMKSKKMEWDHLIGNDGHRIAKKQRKLARKFAKIEMELAEEGAFKRSSWEPYVHQKRKLRECCACDDCRKMENVLGERFKVCSGCKISHYCSKYCQKRAWSSHKANCQRIEKLHAFYEDDGNSIYTFTSPFA